MKESDGWDAVIALIEEKGWWDGKGGVQRKPDGKICLALAVNSIGSVMNSANEKWLFSDVNARMRLSVVEALDVDNWGQPVTDWNDSHTETEVRALLEQLRSEAIAREIETREGVIA